MALCMQWEAGRDASVWPRLSATALTPIPGNSSSLSRWPSQVQLLWPWTDSSTLQARHAGHGHVCGRCGFGKNILFILYYFVFHISSHVHVGGAVLEDGDGTDLAQVYNPKTSVWTEIAPMQIARSGSAACTLKGKLYVIGA